MVNWFHTNYEDPVNRTPYESREGGYQWIWGGPYDAREELSEMFGDIVPEQFIEEVAEELEGEGVLEWAPTPKPEDYDQTEPQDEPPSLDIFSDEPGPQFGTAADHEAREAARIALDKLLKAVEAPRHGGMGHNQPPSAIEEKEMDELRTAATELRLELEKPTPSISLVKRWAAPLRSALIATSSWATKKLDKTVDAAAEGFGKAFGSTLGKAAGVGIIAIVGSKVFPELNHAFDSVAQWLSIAAKTIF